MKFYIFILFSIEPDPDEQQTPGLLTLIPEQRCYSLEPVPRQRHPALGQCCS